MIPLSVLMCVHNGEKYLGDAINSVIRQTWADFDFWVIDDASTDGTRGIINHFQQEDKRIKSVVNEVNIGLTRSLVKGLSLCQSKFVARQDADDISCPQRFQKQMEYLENNPSAGVVATEFDVIDSDGEVLGVRTLGAFSEDIKRVLSKRNVLAHGSLMFRREAIEKAGGYRPVFRCAQDYDLLLRLAETWDIGVLRQTLYQQRLSTGSVSPLRASQQRFFAELALRCSQARGAGGGDDEILRSAGDPSTDQSGTEAAEDVYRTIKAIHLLQSGRRREARETIYERGKMGSRSRKLIYLLTFLPPIMIKGFFQAKWEMEARGFGGLQERVRRFIARAGGQE